MQRVLTWPTMRLNKADGEGFGAISAVVTEWGDKLNTDDGAQAL